MRRLQSGKLFLLTLPFDRPATELELLDARQSALFWHPWAILALIVIAGLIITFFLKGKKLRSPQLWPAAIAIVVGATLADLGTTLWFFHLQSITLEIHPGLKLISYALGRTMGPVLGKCLQLTGIFLAARLVSRGGNFVLILAAGLMLLAAAHNLLI